MCERTQVRHIAKNILVLINKVELSKGLLLGGNADNGANAGLVYTNSNNSAANANANIGSHLCLSKPRFKKYYG